MLALLAAVLCVFANAFFVAAEFALARVRPTALQALARSGDARAARGLEIAGRLDAYLTACQFGITLASLGLGWLGEPALARFIEPPVRALGLPSTMVHGLAVATAFVIITVLHIVVGELVPKSLAILRPEQMTLSTARPMAWFYTLVYPFMVVLNGVSGWIVRAIGMPPDAGEKAKLSVEEIRLIVRASFGEEGVDATKRALIERVLRATDREVRTVMIPRVDVITLSFEASFDDAMEAVRKYGFSRYPVSETGDPDRIAGYVYVKDLLLAAGRPRGGLRALKRDILFVPETKSVGDLLALFQRTGIPLAIVVDEYGGTSGMVTVEDVVEEIVGDLHDELDVEQPRVELREDGTLIVDGALPLGELELEGFDPDPEQANRTLNAYLISQLGRLAHPGDRVRIGSYLAVVEDVRRRRIGRVAIRPYSPSVPPPGASSRSNPPPDEG